MKPNPPSLLSWLSNLGPATRSALSSFLLLLALALGFAAPAQACTTGACVSAGPRLASLDTTRSGLLNPLLGSLLGTNLSLTVTDWNTLAAADLSALSFLTALQVSTNTSTPTDALAASVTLAQVTAALRTAAQAEVNLGLVPVLSKLQSQLAPASASIQLGKLLKVGVNPGALTGNKLNMLDLISGMVQLYNTSNMLTTPTPITVSGAALGLGSLLGSVELSAQVLEPPVYVCGPSGTAFHSAAIRVKLKVALVSIALDTAALNILPGVLGASLTLVDLEVYAEIAAGDGAIGTIDAVARSVMVQAVPGVADLYIGHFDDNVFFNRSHRLAPETDLGYSTIGELTVNGSGVGVLVKSYARGEAPFAVSALFSGSFPQTKTLSTSAAFVSNLGAQLVTNLDLKITPTLGVLDLVVLPLVKTLVSATIGTTLGSVLTVVVDPLLQLLGIGLGELEVTVNGICQVCALSGNVYNDLNNNGLKETGEAGIKSVLYAKVLTGGAVSQVAPVDADTGAYTFQYVPNGSYSLIIDTSSGNGVTATVPAGWVGTVPVSMTRTVVINNLDIGGQHFGLYGGNTEFKLLKSADKASAGPGEVILYTLVYSNEGTGSVSNLKIIDNTPAYTVFGSASCGALAAGLSACSVSSKPAVNATGAVEWTFTGTLLPGASGSITFGVMLD